MSKPDEAPRDPLHGVTLKAMVEDLVAELGWEGLAAKVPARCFSVNPSVPSSLTFLRRTPWAREKIEKLYLWTFHRPFVHKKHRDKVEAAKAAREADPKPEPESGGRG